MAEYRPNEITFFGVTNFRGERKRFGIKQQDRSKHVYIIGKTGMGKSTLLENMTIQDIQAGRGLAVVDPHGEYAERVLDFIPRSRVNDVVYLNPADLEFPIAFNIMEKVSEDQRHILASGLLAVFKKIFGPDVFSARMEYLLANAILALLEVPGSTLLGINRMFGEKEFRRKIVSQLRDPIVKGFWENEFAKYPEQFMREAVAAIQNKVGQFSSNPLIRNIVGQPESSVDLRWLMDEEKIFIVNLSKGRIGEENARLLGAMIVTRLYIAGMSRVDIPESERKPFYLFVDEFQNFATESFASILSEARKYRLNLTVAHQYINQMEEPVQHAIFGNVGTMIVFRVGGEDAEILEKEFTPEFVIEDLVGLGFKNIYLKLMIDGLTSRPFSAETLSPFALPEESNRDEIIKASRERFGRSRAGVEERIRQFTQGTEAGAPVVSGDIVHASVPDAAAPRPSFKADRKMYEAVCAVDGKKIMVPFQPDGTRPVYCEEHMDMIKFRAKAADVSRAPAPDRGNRRDPNAPVLLSLDTLKPRSENFSERPRETEGARSPRPERSEHGGAPRSQPAQRLDDLRKALAESLRNDGASGKAREDSGPVVPPEQGAGEDSRTQNSDARPPQSPNHHSNQAKPLAPGEKIRL